MRPMSGHGHHIDLRAPRTCRRRNESARAVSKWDVAPSIGAGQPHWVDVSHVSKATGVEMPPLAIASMERTR